MQSQLETDTEAKEWIDAISSVIAFEGVRRASDLLDMVVAKYDPAVRGTAASRQS